MQIHRIALYILVSASLPGCSGWKWYYERDLRAVRGRLETIPGVTVKTLGGNEDITLEDIFATIEVAGKGELVLGDLTPRSFESGGQFILHRIGRQSPRYAGYGLVGVYITATGQPVKSLVHGSSLAFGSRNDLAELMPVRVTRVQDLIENFEIIQAALLNWPRCPEYFERSTSDRLEYRLCAEDRPEAYVYPPLK